MPILTGGGGGGSGAEPPTGEGQMPPCSPLDATDGAARRRGIEEGGRDHHDHGDSKCRFSIDYPCTKFRFIWGLKGAFASD